MQILVLNGVRVLGIFPGVHPGVLFLITGYQIYLSIYDMFHIYSFSSSKLFVCLETFLCFLHQFDRAFCLSSSMFRFNTSFGRSGTT